MFETLVFSSTGAKLNRSWFFRSPPKPKYSKVIIHLSEQVSHQDIPDFGGRNCLSSIHLRTGVAGLRLVGSYYRDWEENAVKPAHRISESGSQVGFTLVEWPNQPRSYCWASVWWCWEKGAKRINSIFTLHFSLSVIYSFLSLADLPKEGFQDMDVYEVKSVEISAVNRE